MTKEDEDRMQRLREQGRLKEQPFQSNIPLLGPLVVWFRSLWNSVAAKWYVRPLIQQQSEFNNQVLSRIEDFEDQVYGQLIEQDRDQTHLLHETGELVANLNHLNRMLGELDMRLARLEELGDASAQKQES